MTTTEELLESTFARAFKEAEQRKAEAEAEAERRAAEAERASAVLRVYDPRPYAEAEPHDLTLYLGTGIGALYGVSGCERFLPELAGWTIGREQ